MVENLVLGANAACRVSQSSHPSEFGVEPFLATPSGGNALVFTSEAIENIPAGWRARDTYRVVSEDEWLEIFELAEPGKDFTTYSETRLKKRRPGR